MKAAEGFFARRRQHSGANDAPDGGLRMTTRKRAAD
jgi:hypothetical protein